MWLGSFDLNAFFQEYKDMQKQPLESKLPSMIRHYLSLTTWGIGFTEQNSVYFLEILTFPRLFQESLNQYQACLDSVECISHGDSKYGHEIPQFWHFLPNLLNLWPVVCIRLPRGKH